ncbi:DUF2147 domain-containing protein [Dysgonomonas mossii]|uniref:DUF2147 domain-containing protein n=1 Tax=Dysgonomonas mossii TaxID=163665 RepID=A0A4Y9ITQ0_9BACT|nr:DUF2147 domain-containing protein [Dysgonomonas mossii]MBF0760210.1 DUF2147 domain-containing protein [Dysgonomonas mossii]TFU91159.1 DUF2147 domain-containing protein [Dysgonomonas mossii]
MKNLFLILILLFMSSLAYAQDITGKWLTEDSEAVVETYLSGDKLNGKIVWLKNANDANGKSLIDHENPDKSKRTRTLIGLLMLMDFKQNDGKWEGGKIYDPSEGKTYKCSIWLEKGKLKVRGYIGMFYQTQTWTRKTDG